VSFEFLWRYNHKTHSHTFAKVLRLFAGWHLCECHWGTYGLQKSFWPKPSRSEIYCILIILCKFWCTHHLQFFGVLPFCLMQNLPLGWPSFSARANFHPKSNYKSLTQCNIVTSGLKFPFPIYPRNQMIYCQVIATVVSHVVHRY
jgi:hypothetical protein